MRFQTKGMQKLADLANRNGGVAYNDGKDYYVAGFTYGNEPITPQAKTKSKDSAYQMVSEYSKLPNVTEIVIEKYPNVAKYYRKETEGWKLKRESKGAWAKEYKGIPPILKPLAKEAYKYKSADEYTQAFLRDINHGIWFHVTDNPNFKVSKSISPKDYSSMAGGSDGIKGLMVTGDLDAEAVNMKGRDYVAVLDLSEVPSKYIKQVSRGFGNEMFLPEEVLDKVKVSRVVKKKSAIAYANRYQRALESEIRSGEDLKKIYNQVVVPVKQGAWARQQSPLTELIDKTNELAKSKGYSVDVFYNKPEQSWIGLVKDKRGYQVDNAEIWHTKSEVYDNLHYELTKKGRCPFIEEQDEEMKEAEKRVKYMLAPPTKSIDKDGTWRKGRARRLKSNPKAGRLCR